MTRLRAKGAADGGMVGAAEAAEEARIFSILVGRLAPLRWLSGLGRGGFADLDASCRSIAGELGDRLDRAWFLDPAEAVVLRTWLDGIQGHGVGSAVSAPDEVRRIGRGIHDLLDAPESGPKGPKDPTAAVLLLGARIGLSAHEILDGLSRTRT